MKNILLINPSGRHLYSGSKILTLYSEPSLSLATIAKPLVEGNHNVEILDLSLYTDHKKIIERKINGFSPNLVGITFTTPLYEDMKKIADIVKKLDHNITLVAGGPHASNLPVEMLKDSNLDIAVIGEGDFTLRDTVEMKKLRDVKGLCFKKGRGIFNTGPRGFIENLDTLPYPAFDLCEVKKYKTSRLLARKNPVTFIETSRGCVFNCIYCYKMFGNKFRFKSAKRVVDEMEYALNVGFREIHIADDAFTTDIRRAKEICREIKRRGLEFNWSMDNGIRVDQLDKEFLQMAYDSGCYRVCFGVETGDERVLRTIEKGITIEKVVDAFRMSKDVGLETVGFFMIGLPGENEESIKKTIKLAKDLEPDYVKMSITTPLPGSPLFRILERQGRIKTRDWSKYNYHNPREVYDHPELQWSTIMKYYNLFYKEFYFRPKFIFKRLALNLFHGKMLSILTDFKYFIKMISG